jgi:predicted HD phosphohydrolase
MKIFTEEFMNPLFNMLEECEGVEQKDTHHPEGNVFVHSLQVLKWAFKESTDTDLILAAMLHDVGKVEKSNGHENIAVEMLTGLVSVKTLWLIEQHMRIWYLILGQMKKYKKVQDLVNHPWLPELVLLARWDKRGRNPNTKNIKYDKQNIMDRLNKCVELHFENFRGW